MSIYIGAHINREKTIIKTMETITKNGGNCLQLFVSNPRSTSLVNIDNYLSIADDIKEYSAKHNFKTIIHSSYTINLARECKNGKRVVPMNECSWIQTLLHELYISHIIGSSGVVVHVGKHTTQTREQGLENMRTALEYVIDNLQKNEISAKVVLETPAGQGTELLTDLNEFLIFYNSFTEEQKKYLGICLDTAHIWAAGYELSDAHKMISNKNAQDLVAIHLNNSKVIKGSSVDRHATLFDNTGTIPYNSIKQYLELLRDKKKDTKHLPIIILETPSTKYADELLWIANIL
jgi:deoxyribonuclease-4